MSKWKLEVNDDGDEVLIFDESHSLVTWNLEDTDDCCYEILHLIIKAPEMAELLVRIEEVLPGIIWIADDRGGYSNQVDELETIREQIRKLLVKPLPETNSTEDFLEATGLSSDEIPLDTKGDNYGEFSDDNLFMHSIKRKPL